MPSSGPDRARRLIVVLGYSDGRSHELHPICAARLEHAARLADEGEGSSGDQDQGRNESRESDDDATLVGRIVRNPGRRSGEHDRRDGFGQQLPKEQGQRSKPHPLLEIRVGGAGYPRLTGASRCEQDDLGVGGRPPDLLHVPVRDVIVKDHGVRLLRPKRGEQPFLVIRLGHDSEAVVFQEPPDQGSLGIDRPGDGDSDAVASRSLPHLTRSSPLGTHPSFSTSGRGRQNPGVMTRIYLRDGNGQAKGPGGPGPTVRIGKIAKKGKSASSMPWTATPERLRTNRMG